MTILVSPLSQVLELVAMRKPHHVISVLDPGVSFPELGVGYHDRHLRLSFHDAHHTSPGITIPSEAHIRQILSFLDDWGMNETILIHCRAGIGRSTATAFMAACYRNPEIPELRIALELRRVAPLARPNEAVVRLADDALKRGGRMSAAIADSGRGLGWVDVAEGIPFELMSSFGS